jgi:uncharacterized membrane-anchored protein YhcB (DUF1043 family)
VGIEEHIGDYGVAIAIIIGAVLMTRILARTFTTALGIWQSVSEGRQKVDAERNQVEETIMQTIQVVAQALPDEHRKTRNEFDRGYANIAKRQEMLFDELREALNSLPLATAAEVETRLIPHIEALQRHFTRAATDLLDAKDQIDKLVEWFCEQTKPGVQKTEDTIK